MTTKFKLTVLMVLITALNACKKDEKVGFDSTSMNNENISSFVEKSVGDDEDAVTMKSMMGGGGPCDWLIYLPECAVVTESGTDFPKTITIDYGTGCTDLQGHVKSGVIVIDLTDDIINEGAVRSVTFQDFYVNNIHIEGSRIFTNTGYDDAGHPMFSRNVNVTLTHNANSFVRNFNGIVTWLSGYDTVECGDNIFQLEGSGTVTRPNGTVITRTIVDPLILDRICGYITQGTVLIAAPLGMLTMSFGDGTCDNIAVVTNSDGETQTIYLGQ